MRPPVRSRVTAAAAVLTVLTAPILLASPASADKTPDPEKLAKAAKTRGIMRHLEKFQHIADKHGGTRAAGTPGYAASARYVYTQLKQAGYDVRYQKFEFPYFQQTADPVLKQVSPEAKTYEVGSDFQTMTYSGSGDVTATVQPVDLQLPPGAEPNSSTSGCQASDFSGFTAGDIALIQRGSCTFEKKALNAEEAGAVGVIIFNEGQQGRRAAVAGTLGNPGVTVPVVGASFAVGKELASAETTTVHLKTATVSETRTTKNVIAETKGGDPSNTVMLGAHLDSVPAGAGINDNASGSAGLLEVALEGAKLLRRYEPENKIRFAWWGAEEFGLLGAQAYVDSLSKQQQQNIQLYLNFDMIGSTNFVRFVYDGDNSTGEGMQGPPGSGQIEQMFKNYFEERGLETAPTPFNGRSDYGPFINVGIPAGGLFTGAEGIKTEKQAETYGGTAGKAYDPCYHQACDDLSNIDKTVLRQMTGAVAYSAFVYGYGLAGVDGSQRQMSARATSQARSAAGFEGDVAA